MQLPEGPYSPQSTESKILEYWLQNKFYKPEYDPSENRVKSVEEMKADSREAFCIICPPPNAYGRPHLGNISGYAYQDAMGRYARMQGKKVLLLPGKDHAGLEGEGVFVREVLEKKEIDKFSLTREQFYQMIWEFNMENKKLALNDEQAIGLSADFDRDIFTLDPKIVDTVLSTFVEMFNQNMIYRGVRLVNWDPKARSAVADNQCVRKEREGTIYTLSYPLVDGSGAIQVATTRPETMFGDTAVAVHPEDERYRSFIGKLVRISLTETEIPVITSPRVEKEFGTGALKITPAHAQDDWTIMQEWNNANPDKAISYVNVIGQDLKLVGPVPAAYKGQKYKQALPQIIEDLKASGALIKEEKLMQNILVSERTGAVIEPLMSGQWFVDIDTIRQPVIDMVKSGKVKIHPKNMEDKFFFWMENLRDWAISRSLWWGYRMPVWYAGAIEERVDEAGKIEIWITKNEVGSANSEILDPNNSKHMRVQLQSPGEGWIQDENVLDTWFSSGQWPYATLGAYDLTDTFYPTTVMETGYDILENWVSRMMMFSYLKMKDIPFRDVYLHGLVQGKDGQKMSKSKGNILYFDDIRNQYGTDALRMVYFYQNSAGDSYAMTDEKLKMFRNFNNKIWNATRFVLANIEDVADTEAFEQVQRAAGIDDFSTIAAELQLTADDKKMLEEITKMETEFHRLFGEFRFGLVTEQLYESMWHYFCDIYLEQVKDRVWKEKSTDANDRFAAQAVLYYCLKSYVKMLHPFVPFITEEIWKYLPKGSDEHESIMYARW